MFQDYSIDVALRAFLGRFALPGEAQKIDRILQAFARSYFAANPSDPTCASEDAVYALAFSLVLLNTDAHNPRLAKRFKMGKDDFVRSHRRLAVHLPRAYLEQCYDSFVSWPITLLAKKPPVMSDDEVELEFGDGPLGLAIETSIDGRTCLVKKFSTGNNQSLAGWVVVAVADDSTRQIGYPLVRYLLRTAPRPVAVRFCEPSVYFASLH